MWAALVLICMDNTPGFGQGLGAGAGRAGTWQWQTVTNDPSSMPRDETALTVLNGKLYLLGGRGITPVEEYDLSTNGWKKLAPPPIEMNHFQAVAVDGRIAVVGAMNGQFPHEQPLTNVWWFDPRKDEWSKGAEIPEARRRGAGGTALYDHRVYLIGGITDGHWSGSEPWMDMLDLKSGKWTRLPDAPHARDHVQVAVVKGKIIVAGGRTSDGSDQKVFDLTVPAVDVFDIATRKWKTLSKNIPTPRAGAMTVARDGKVIIIGGESMSQTEAHREVQALSLATGKWESLPDLNQGSHGTGAAFIGDTLYVASGVGKRGGHPQLTIMQKLNWPAKKR
jgi:N-acetylneuraminic acid mutarotase